VPSYVNQFASPTFVEETIVRKEGGVVGRIRLKPSSVLWKPLGQHKYYAVSLDDFASWITNSKTHASRTKS
jgi:hypothetical protein